MIPYPSKSATEAEVTAYVDQEIERIRVHVERVGRMAAHASARLVALADHRRSGGDTIEDAAWARRRSRAWRRVEALLAPVAADMEDEQ